MNYHDFRAFADTWGLVLLALLFVILIVWLFRRGATKEYERAARIPLDAPESPAGPDQSINDIKAARPADDRPDEKGTKT
ncbi:cbb3-type cytochrome c oxidase subunit 3 [Acuticoccus sp. MNP-M23]|uniref:cbb3-type cytochrome c oxidase subunit 3 n=1 Tax=Acuticoccus sp. MNP-M23 TaxID=3072793 RepID=UPI0028168D5F|nr:cbb3-type cytochrome c oxidase subunit 3 [Acuticoccus sp. MNP-M23]WMS44120.1 cbb3-type cytochrome c oxidase subunit 3 [Acuticoccus sp. MNP-M23]